MARKKIKPLKKKRKLSEEHKEKLRTRLAEMRAKKKPAEYKNIAKSVLALPEDDIANVLIGLSELHDIRCKKLFNVFESMVKDKCFVEKEISDGI